MSNAKKSPLSRINPWEEILQIWRITPLNHIKLRNLRMCSSYISPFSISSTSLRHYITDMKWGSRRSKLGQAGIGFVSDVSNCSGCRSVIDWPRSKGVATEGGAGAKEVTDQGPDLKKRVQSHSTLLVSCCVEVPEWEQPPWPSYLNIAQMGNVKD